MMPLARYGRNMSMNSDSSKVHDDLESSEMDMEMSDDDGTGMDSKNISGGKINLQILKNTFTL
jgi:hypothetical protein